MGSLVRAQEREQRRSRFEKSLRRFCWDWARSLSRAQVAGSPGEGAIKQKKPSRRTGRVFSLYGIPKSRKNHLQKPGGFFTLWHAKFELFEKDLRLFFVESEFRCIALLSVKEFKAEKTIFKNREVFSLYGIPNFEWFEQKSLTFLAEFEFPCSEFLSIK